MGYLKLTTVSLCISTKLLNHHWSAEPSLIKHSNVLLLCCVEKVPDDAGIELVKSILSALEHNKRAIIMIVEENCLKIYLVGR